MYIWQDTLETKMKDEVKALEDAVEQLEEKLSKKKADNQPQAASTPVSPLLPQSEQVSHVVWFLQRAAWMALRPFVIARSCCCFILHCILN
jgi:phage shock protein A